MQRVAGLLLLGLCATAADGPEGAALSRTHEDGPAGWGPANAIGVKAFYGG